MKTRQMIMTLVLFFVPLSLLALIGCGGGPPGYVPPDIEGGGPEVTPEGVVFTFIDPEINRLNIVGDFNNWSTAADPLFDRAGDGTWTVRIPLKPGRYEYKYLIDGEKWAPDPWNPETTDDGFGGFNSVIVVE